MPTVNGVHNVIIYMEEKSKVGHRQRLRERFIEGEKHSRSDEALLELLLTYAIPQKDVQPLAKRLLIEFGSLSSVLDAPVDSLCEFDGIKFGSATLLKLVDWIGLHNTANKSGEEKPQFKQLTLIDDLPSAEDPAVRIPQKNAHLRRKIVTRRGTELFGKAVLREAIELLPHIPDTESLDNVRQFFRNNLHFNSEQTRVRYTNYIVRRMFPEGYVDEALRIFAKHFSQSQDLREVCFYRFVQSEPIVLHVLNDLILPCLDTGKLNRRRIREYLKNRYQSSNFINDCAKGVVDALIAGGLATADRIKLSFGMREISLPALTFVLHSEFPEPGMYDIAKVEDNISIRTMLWYPGRILTSLYELRNMGLISKISEIDNVRQFTTRWTLDQAVELLISGGKRP